MSAPSPRRGGAAERTGVRRLLAAGSTATLLLGIVCVAAFGQASGGSAALGAGIAAIAVGAFFLSGAAPVLLVDRSGRASPVALPLVLAGYVLRLVLLAAVLTRLARGTGFDRAAFAITVLICSLGWLSATTVAAITERDAVGNQQQSRTARQ